MLSLSDIAIQFGDNRVVSGVDLSLQKGELGSLLGASGSGKTSILKAIAGFKELANGEILLRDQVVSSPTSLVPPENRNIGMMFQDLALFPHLNVKENVAFGLRNLTKELQQKKVQEMLTLVSLEGFENREIYELSGGQQQRIALARALAPEPSLLLLDEPFSSLDTELRTQLTKQIRVILKEQGVTALLVTHDQQEAFTFSDKIAVLQDGRLLQQDTPFNLYHKPASKEIASFIGEGRFLRGKITESFAVATAIGELTNSGSPGLSPGTEVEVLIRPDDIIHYDESDFKMKVIGKSFQGAHIFYELQTLDAEPFETLVCWAPSHHDHNLGESIGVAFDIDHLIVFPA